MKIFRLILSDGPTSAPFNQFTNGFKNKIEQVVFTFSSTNKNLNTPSLEFYNGSGSILRSIKIIKSVITSNDLKAIHIHSGHLGLILLISLLPTNVKYFKIIIFTFHTSWHLLKFRNKCLVFLTFLISKRIIPCSRSSFSSLPYFVKYFFKDKINIIQNGFNSESIRSKSINKSNYLFKKQNALKIVSVGALNKNKNHEMVIRELCKNKSIDWEFIIIGDGTNRTFLENLASDESNIRLLGLLNRDTVIKYMLEANIFISMSKGEGLPIAVLEAMASSCVTFLSDIPPHREIKAPEGACFIIKNDKDISKKLKYINRLDLKKVNSLGRLNRLHVEKRFNLQSMLDEYEKVYYGI